MVIEIADLSIKHGDFPYLMWLKRCHKPPMTGKGSKTYRLHLYSNSKNGELEGWFMTLFYQHSWEYP